MFHLRYSADNMNLLDNMNGSIYTISPMFYTG